MKTLVLKELGICWDFYYRFRTDEDSLILLKSWRRRKDSPKKVDGIISRWCDSQCRLGVDIEYFKRTGKIIHRPKDHLMIYGKDDLYRITRL